MQLFSDVPNNGTEAVKLWVLFQAERQRLPSMEMGLPKIVTNNIMPLVHVENPFVRQLLQQLNMPKFFVSEVVGDGWRLGSAWTVRDRSVWRKQSDEDGGEWIPVESGPVMRLATYEAAARAIVFATVKMSDDVVAFQKIREMDGRWNLCTYGLMNRHTGRVISCLDVVAQRSCPFCTASERVCDCAPELTETFFNKQLLVRQQLCRESKSLAGATSARYINAWLDGNWTIRVNGHLIASSVVTSFTSMDKVKSSVIYLVQSEMNELLKPTMGLPSTEDSTFSNLSHSSEDRKRTLLTQGDLEEETPKNKEKVKSHACPICGATVLRRCDIQRHIRDVHEKIREHQCLLCLKSFLQKSHLNGHIRAVHRGSMDNMCPTCGKTFGSPSTLKRHVLAVHENARNSACPHCDKTYKDNTALKKHIRSKHNQELTSS